VSSKNRQPEPRHPFLAHKFTIPIERFLNTTNTVPLRTMLSETSSETFAPTVIINPPKRQPTWTGFHSPIEERPSRLRMTNCGEVREIYGTCLAQRSSDDMCKAAASYFSICSISSGSKE
jgi:hypothetical protein